MSSKFDPEVLTLLDLMQKSGAPDMSTLDMPQLREAYFQFGKAFAGEQVQLERVIDVSIGENDHVLALRLYFPKKPSDKKTPLVVYFHGGGWVMGSVEGHDNVCRRLAKLTGAIVASVDYRLAPESPPPAAVKDCITAVRWLSENSTKFGIDQHKVALAGDSAGGNLAALCSGLLRDSNISIASQVLFYPCTDLSEEAWSFPSRKENYENPPLTGELAKKLIGIYLSSSNAEDKKSLSPLLCADLKGLPPTFIVTAELDVLRDDGVFYAAALNKSGVQVEHLELPGTIHGFIEMLGALPGAERALMRAAEFIKEKFSS
ncbi:alpha/beta hydrolase [Pseudomonas yamanorum]|uniref:alpha/beta hydrolase n=1 Tax=Pseudomonas yamanorum TaxID=515393 RepID=UPI003F750B7D